MTYLLLWLLAGSLTLNYMWIQNHKATIFEMREELEGCENIDPPAMKHYIKGIAISLISGPLTLLVKMGIDKWMKE